MESKADEMETGGYDHWRAAWASLVPRPPGPEHHAELLACYAEPHRAYHTLEHIAECLAVLDAVRAAAERPAEVELAIWYHDAVYDTRRSDNEARSAAWVERLLVEAGAGTDAGERVRALVLATRHDAAPEAGDAALLVDVDLSILAAAPERFDAYERSVRSEYAWVPGPIFRRTRARILRGFLARPRIYATRALAHLEASARANLTRSLAALGG